MKKKQLLIGTLVAALCVSVWGLGVNAETSRGGSASITFDDSLDSLSGFSAPAGNASGGASTRDTYNSDTNFFPNVGGNTNQQVIFDLEPGTVMILDNTIPLSQLGDLPKTGGSITADAVTTLGSNGLVPGLLLLAGTMCLLAASDKKSMGIGI